MRRTTTPGFIVPLGPNKVSGSDDWSYGARHLVPFEERFFRSDIAYSACCLVIRAPFLGASDLKNCATLEKEESNSPRLINTSLIKRITELFPFSIVVQTCGCLFLESGSMLQIRNDPSSSLSLSLSRG